MKKAIKRRYIELLQATYPFYIEGSKSLAMAKDAADNALNGMLKLEGVCWERAVNEISGLRQWTNRDLANLPD